MMQQISHIYKGLVIIFSFIDNLGFVIMKYSYFVMYYYDLISLMYISMPKLAIACADNNEIVQVDIYG